MASFKEAVIIPLALFKRCNFADSKEPVLEGLPLDVKMKLLQHERLLNPKGKLPTPLQIKVVKAEEKEPEVSTSGGEFSPNSDTITESVAQANRPFVQSILDIIQKNPDQIRWNENFEVIIDGKLYPNTNVVTIMQALMKHGVLTRDADLPEKLKVFHSKLLSLGVPKTWIKAKFQIVRATRKRRKAKWEEEEDEEDEDEEEEDVEVAQKGTGFKFGKQRRALINWSPW